MKFLVVDDDVISRSKMVAIVERFGAYHSVESGKAAISLFQAHLEESNPFDMIMLDIGLPDMDGTEVLYHIREMENAYHVAKADRVIIIMVTSHSDKDHVITSLQVGCNDYVAKPFDLTLIRRKLEEIQSKKQSRSVSVPHRFRSL